MGVITTQYMYSHNCFIYSTDLYLSDAGVGGVGGGSGDSGTSDAPECPASVSTKMAVS